MLKECTVQAYVDGGWCDAAAVTLVGAPTSGIRAQTLLAYAAVLVRAVREMAAPLARLMDEATALGIGDVLATRRMTVEYNLQQLMAL